MKKLLFFFALLIGFSTASFDNEAKAQGPVVMTASVDTLADSTVGYLTKEITGAVGQLGIQIYLARVGSTTIGGTAYVEASNDPSAFGWDRIDAVTYTITNSATQTNIFPIGDINFKHYRVRIENTEAGNIILSGKASVRSNK